jgi:hypothetical protein
MERRITLWVALPPKEHGKVERMTPDQRRDYVSNYIVTKNLRDKIGPTDPIVLGKHVWCLVKGHLFPHPEKNDHTHGSQEFGETITIVSAKTPDSVTWSCATTPFEVLSITPTEPHPRFMVPPFDAQPLSGNEEPQPFQKTLPYRVLSAGGGEVNSGPVKPSAARTQYKITFRIDGEEVDPDVFCSP